MHASTRQYCDNMATVCLFVCLFLKRSILCQNMNLVKVKVNYFKITSEKEIPVQELQILYTGHEVTVGRLS